MIAGAVLDIRATLAARVDPELVAPLREREAALLASRGRGYLLGTGPMPSEGRKMVGILAEVAATIPRLAERYGAAFSPRWPGPDAVRPPSERRPERPVLHAGQFGPGVRGVWNVRVLRDVEQVERPGRVHGARLRAWSAAF